MGRCTSAISCTKCWRWFLPCPSCTSWRCSFEGWSTTKETTSDASVHVTPPAGDAPDTRTADDAVEIQLRASTTRDSSERCRIACRSPRSPDPRPRRSVQPSLSSGIRPHASALAGYLRPIAPVHLDTILELLLNYLVSLSLSHDAAPVEDLVSALVEAHDVPREVSSQVMGWFGQVDEGTWKMDVKAVVAEIGLGILRHHKVLFVSPPASPRAEHGTMGKARTHSRDRIHDEMEKRRRGRVRVGCVAPTALRTSIPPYFRGTLGLTSARRAITSETPATSRVRR